MMFIPRNPLEGSSRVNNESGENEETTRLTEEAGAPSYGSSSDSAATSSAAVSSASGSTAPPPATDSSTAPANPSNSPESTTAEEAPVHYDEAVEDVVTSLTRRVRYLFSVITWPIVPLGTIASLALGWLIYASFVLDVGKSCSHPLHWYAVLSLILVIYAPYHSRIRSFLFNYQRERGSERPPGVRRYDQLFHTLALIYVYAGITLVQTCRDDISILSPPQHEGIELLDSTTSLPPLPPPAAASTTNTCAATCPNLFPALRVYVATIEIFTFSLILPLLFLPCLYLYFIRRTMQDAESLAVLQDRFREEEALMRNGGVTTQEIMDQFDKVNLVQEDSTSRVWVVNEGSPPDFQAGEECGSKECCICMESFLVQEDDEEMGATANATRDDAQQVIRTRTCKHLFHRRCMASWVGGRWQHQHHPQNEETTAGATREWNRRARRTTCPLCRRDVRPNR